MTPEQLFLISGRIAMSGWLMLALALFSPPALSMRLRWVGGRAIPVLLSSTYAACIALWWSGSEGGFESLEALARLFSHQGLLLFLVIAALRLRTRADLARGVSR